MMSALFEKQSMPFYKFGENLHIGKISSDEWVSFITNQFLLTGKSIVVNLAQKIASAVKCHCYYVQQLSHLVWQRTTDNATEQILTAALDDLLSQNAMLYLRDTEMLSKTQLNFMKALASGITQGFSNQQNLLKFKLGSSANVSKVRKVLVERELIEIHGKDTEFLDPAYELWFVREILKK